AQDLELEWAADSRPRQVVGGGDLELQLREESDWFAAHGSLQAENGRVLELQELLRGLEPGSRFVPLGDDTFFALTEENRQTLEQLRRLGQEGATGLRLHPLLAPALEELHRGIQADRSFAAHLSRIRQAESVEIVVPTTLHATLRPYQEEGFRWLARLAEWGAGACLADDMGLGKTLQSLALLLRRAAGGPALVVAPTSVVGGWEEEAQRFAPTLQILRFGDGNREEMLAKVGPGVVVLCSYGLLQSEEERLSQVAWHSLILDEAQQIKNSGTQRFRAATALKADFRMACSGTPIENHLGELWSLFHFLSPGLLGSLADFRKRYQLPIEQGNDADARAALQRMVRPFILRRTKASVLTELPSRTEVNLQVELGPEEAALYEALRRQALASLTQSRSEDPTWRLRVLAEITRLRQAACNARLVTTEGEAPPS
ncbi:MAG TPA: SNF2-related protein, partial [Myxococcota bacterium]|nr:SNF2-related protein [Myxococcota bacterium]